MALQSSPSRIRNGEFCCERSLSIDGKGSPDMTLKLAAAWTARLNLRAEGEKLWADGNKLWADGNKLWAEGDRLRAEGNKLRADGNKLWAEAIIEAYGNITLSWTWRTDHGECALENGDVYDDTIKTAEAA